MRSFKKILKILAKNAPWYKLRVVMFRMCGYSIGKDVYIGEDLIVSDELDESGNVIIEDGVSIAPRVTLITTSGPNLSIIRPYVKTIKGKIRIKRGAWIGAGVIILPNVTIGEGTVVGAGAVVIKDVPPYTVVVGVPAKIIKKLDVIKNENPTKFDTEI